MYDLSFAGSLKIVPRALMRNEGARKIEGRVRETPQRLTISPVSLRVPTPRWTAGGEGKNDGDSRGGYTLHFLAPVFQAEGCVDC